MPFDGLTAIHIVDILNEKLIDGRVEKALQPERDEIVLVIRARGANHRLLMSADANCARIHITEKQKENPQTPPSFCMLLRKHIVGGKINRFSCINYDRIIEIEFATTNDFGESCIKYLLIEIMGRHSNIMLLNQDKKILDSIKHIDFDISSVREVMPGRPYILPPQQDKITPTDLLAYPEKVTLLFDFSQLSQEEILLEKDLRIDKFLLNRIKGLSPMAAREICTLANVDSTLRCNSLLFSEKSTLNIKDLSEAIVSFLSKAHAASDEVARSGRNSGYVFFKEESLSQAFEFYFTEITQYEFKKQFDNFNQALDSFYSFKDDSERLLQKKSALFKLISNNIERCLKKISILEASITEAEQRDKYRLYGELIMANLYQIDVNEPVDKITVSNYFSTEVDTDGNLPLITIPIDPAKSINHNARNYFRKYEKAKSTLANATTQLGESQAELAYMQSVSHSLDTASDSAEIAEIRNELISENYIKKPSSKSKKNSKHDTPTKPRIITFDGFEILVGRNNHQNDQLTLKIASKNDIWLHTKNIPGSHVIIRAENRQIPENVLQKSAEIAAFYSKAADSYNVPVDYTSVRNVKKPSGAKPGMVIYEGQKTLYVTPKI